MGWFRDIARVARQVFRREIAAVRTHTPAQVVSFDPDQNTCSVQPCIKILRTDDPNHTYTQDLPQIDDVPVHQQGSGKTLLSQAPQVGSYGMLHISDRRLEKWLTDGGIVEPNSTAKFDISDASFVPGLYPLVVDGDNGKLPAAIKTDRIELRTRAGDTYIAVLDDGTIEIESTGTVSINGTETILQEGTDYAIQYTEMNNAYNNLKADLNAFIAKYNLHNHPTAPVGPVSTPSVVGTVSTSAMTAAKVDDVRLPGTPI
jgi:hypothetical protein